MKKILSLLLVLGLCFGLTGCGGDSEEEPPKDEKQPTEEKDTNLPLEISDSGYSIDDQYLVYGVAVKNPNKKQSIQFPKYTVTAYAEDNSIISTGDQTLNLIGPGETVYWAGQLDCKGKIPAKVDFVAKNGKDDYISKESLNEYLVVENSSKIDSDYYTSFTGQVRNNHKKDIDQAAVIIIYKSEGKIVGGEYSFVDDIAPEQTVPFEISSYKEITYDSFEIFAYDWSF